MDIGKWKKYEKATRYEENENKNCSELYKDLKDCDKNWAFVRNYNKCVDELCGEEEVFDGTQAGDIYVFYVKEDNALVPEFYLKVVEREDWRTNQIESIVYFNGNYYIKNSGINEDYLPDIIDKLNEIDIEKYSEVIDELKARYKKHKELKKVLEKNKLDGLDLLLLYEMAYQENNSLALSVVRKRNIQDDFDSLTVAGRVRMFKFIKGTDVVKNIKLDGSSSSKKILNLRARRMSLSELDNACDSIINDKEYILNLLKKFFKSGNEALFSEECISYLPDKYKSDIDVLTLLIKENPGLIFPISTDFINDSKFNEKIKDPKFAYMLVDCFARNTFTCIGEYYEKSFFSIIPDEILSDIENHVLIGPETSFEKEKNKNDKYQVIKDAKIKVLKKNI